MEIPGIKLHKGREQSVLRRHPWIFSRAIHSATDGLEDGSTVTIHDSRGDVIGVGHYQDSSLAVRIITFQEENIDAAFWQKRLQEAAEYRLKLGLYKPGHTDTFRLVHGEGDQLPGLIIDIYGDVAVLQAHSIGMHKARVEIAEALTRMEVLKIKSVYSKSHDALPAEYAKETTDEWLIGDSSPDLIVHEGGIRFYIDVVAGQKTGFFLDQHENRELVRRYSNDKSVLNCFCYTGGFSLYALSGGAAEVTSIDTSVSALAILEKNLITNHFEGKHISEKENVMTYLVKHEALYDIVIVDPPAFAKNISKRHNAIQAYKRLNILAMGRVKKGGMLFTFSCSQVVDKEMFHNTIVAAAIESGRLARISHELSQGPDHPVSIFHPEGHYLKGLALYMD
ncbi:MAG TPA: class I SAM-dependent rRNA methyltransferase [Saprospiraceae bacterium]|nr:class I SAM-dependent rRNA methyltransferase [Saprospiraceae bacterium]